MEQKKMGNLVNRFTLEKNLKMINKYYQNIIIKFIYSYQNNINIEMLNINFNFVL